MFKSYEMELAGRKLVIESGKIVKNKAYERLYGDHKVNDGNCLSIFLRNKLIFVLLIYFLLLFKLFLWAAASASCRSVIKPSQSSEGGLLS